MAGHRRGRGPGGTVKPRRSDTRVTAHRHRVETAPTGRAQLAAAFDRLRSAAVRLPGADLVLHDLATDLNTRAIELERRLP